jgi:hypothetical protein
MAEHYEIIVVVLKMCMYFVTLPFRDVSDSDENKNCCLTEKNVRTYKIL